MVAADSGALQSTLPTLFVDPTIHAIGPVRALGMDTLSHSEAGGIELKNGEIGELISIRVEELVIVNIVMLTKNPAAIRAEIGLGRLSFDLIVQGFLAFVGVRKIELVSKEQSRRQNSGC